MRVLVSGAANILEERGLLQHQRQDHPGRTIDHVETLLGTPLPEDLTDFYRARIMSIGAFEAVAPLWTERAGWKTPDWEITQLKGVQAAPLFYDGCGSLFGLDLSAPDRVPAVYFFDHEDRFSRPHWAAGSSLGAFLLLLAEYDQARDEARAPGWELSIDPDIDKCSRAPAIWDAG